MDTENHGLSLVTLLIAAAAISGYFFNETPPRSDRPLAPDRLEHRNAHSQDVPARLWQDPFDVIDAARRTRKQPPSDTPARDKPGNTVSRDHIRFKTLIEDIDTKGSQRSVLVLPVTVSGSNQPESQEMRRRVRYAVVSALIGSGYEPEQPGHIGYAIDPDAFGATNAHPDSRRQQVYPYEWFRKEIDDHGASRSLLIVWVNNDLLGDTPISTMVSWQRHLQPTTHHNHPILRVIGTFGSDTLLNLAKELNQWQPPKNVPEDIKQGTRGLVILAPTATIDEQELPGWTNTLGLRWSSILAGSQLLRITNTDSALMKTIVDELRQRNIDPNCKADHLGCRHIALISESDTLYGRRLPVAFTQASKASGNGTIHRFSYLRGLDGRIPGARAIGSAPDKPHESSDNIQASFGEARIDYLERLADRIQRHDQRLRLSLKGRLGAIGVLGSDVYDKLLILQALRHRFPGIVFFTTDLDARLLDSGNLPWTRNLVVVSDFGLQLSDPIQQSVPPFRSSYQTATFLAALLAVRQPTTATPDYSDLKPALNVRLFEIGHDRAYPLSQRTGRGKPLTQIGGQKTRPEFPLRLHPDDYIDPSPNYHIPTVTVSVDLVR
jgi:hypothetical protein